MTCYKVSNFFNENVTFNARTSVYVIDDYSQYDNL